jgi:hypothetical protein
VWAPQICGKRQSCASASKEEIDAVCAEEREPPAFCQPVPQILELRCDLPLAARAEQVDHLPRWRRRPPAPSDRTRRQVSGDRLDELPDVGVELNRVLGRARRVQEGRP